jgi:hypothetical protein
MSEDNIIHITDLGLQAANNAQAGGILINIVYFKLGDSDVLARDTDEDIIGNTLYQNVISLVEVLDTHSVRFTFDVPDHVIPATGMTLKEVGFFIDNNIMFGRCVFANAYVLRSGYTTRIHAILTTTRMECSVINVTIGDFTSIPSIPTIYRLPPPESSQQNAVSVLDCIQNIDGTISPCLALRFGSGSLQWGFGGHERVFSGYPTTVVHTGPTEFTQDDLTNAVEFRNGEVVLVYCVAGPARGSCRKFYYVLGGNKFVEKDGQPLPTLSIGCTLVIWRSITATAMPPNYPPPMVNVPPDWVLTRGVTTLPVWAPPKNTGRNLNTLYVTPGKLRVATLNYVGDGQSRRYSLGGLVVQDVNYCINAIGGVTQHNSAYDIAGSEIEYSDYVPPHASIDLRLFTKEAGTGTYVDIVRNEFICDGARTRFVLTKPVENSAYALCYIRGLLQAVTAYTYDATTQEITFVTPPPEGLDLEISAIVWKQQENYSTEIITTTVITVDATLFLELPIVPQTIDNTFVSVSGTHIHRNNYTLVENKLVFSSPIQGGLEVEVLIFNNVESKGTPQTNLGGIVTDAVVTSKSIKLLRHNAYPVIIPIPAIDIVAGVGIKVSGAHPSYKIENTFAQQFTEDTSFKFSTLRRQQDSEEIIYTYRVNLVSDLVVQIAVDFSAVLGPGFVSIDGMEKIQYVIGFRTTSAREPEYGRDIKGTGEAGFSSLAGAANERAFSNASLTQVLDIIKSNIPAGYIDIVARMRVRNANTSKYGSKLTINFNVIGSPKL